MDILHVPEEKITVIYHGAPPQADRQAMAAQPLVAGRYLLFVGHRASYKNFLPMLRSLVSVFDRHPDLRLVCTGHPFRKEELKLFSTLGVAGRLVHLRPDDHGMANLYAHAEAFIFPSLYEGFGIPILEAWQARCPVLLNHASCFPEVAGEGAVYFHLTADSDDLQAVVEDFLAWTPERRQSLLDTQSQRLGLYKWETSARQLAEVYERVRQGF